MKSLVYVLAAFIIIGGFISVLTMETGSSDMLFIKLIALAFIAICAITFFFGKKKDDNNNNNDNDN